MLNKTKGITEIGGSYYSVRGKPSLLETIKNVADSIDGLKFSGGSFALMSYENVKHLVETLHQNNIYVSTGGWIERVLRGDADIVERYLKEVKNLGFDVLELSLRATCLPLEDLLWLIEKVNKLGIKPRPELELDPGVEELIQDAKLCIGSGAPIILVNADDCKSEDLIQIINEIGIEKVMFKALDSYPFEIRFHQYRNEMNVLLDQSQFEKS